MLFTDIETNIKRALFPNFSAFSHSVLSNAHGLDMQATVEMGLRCSNLSQVFALAYRCALQTLLPQLNARQWAAMCVSEAQGNHPKQIQTYMDADQLVHGEKCFVTMASLAQQMIVLTKVGESAGLPMLKAVLVSREQPGVHIRAMPSLKMLKDLPHGQVQFASVTGKVLPGDGYSDYSKAFRTFEDVYVLLASTTFILSHAWRNRLDVEIIQKSLALISQLYGLSLQPSYWLHLQLAEGFDQFKNLCDLFEGQLDQCSDDFQEQWHADKKIFSLASSARKARTDKAKLELLAARGEESK